ncbi:MAG TPA: OmpA family protein [Bacteroidota bacterium]|nr:OmpA family protein [Bacteroidota bacterium]
MPDSVRYTLFIPVCLALLIAGFCTAPAQENLRAQLFGVADSLILRVKERKADILAPANYKKAMRYYNGAAEDFKKGGNLEEMRENVANASVYFAKALDIAKIGEVAFSAAMAARTDALSADAPTQQPELWKKAEEKFNRAASDMEDGDMGSGNRLGSEATGLYRSAELEAIKSNYLTPARVLLEKAKKISVEDTAPQTLERARQLAARTEEMLKQNRYDTDEARELAQEAKYEAAHAIALHQAIVNMKKDDRNFETTLLGIEEQIQRISSALGLKARFDAGYDQPAGEAIEAVKERDRAIDTDATALSTAASDIHDKEVENENLRQQISSMEKRVGSLTDTEKELQQRLATHRSQEGTIRGVEGMFTSDEGIVLREGSKIIIRLYGLSFPSGKNSIEPQYYNLLTKVQQAIRKFPKSEITIEGHTDAIGTDEVNQKLSESRALAVAEYLMANMGVEIPIASQGYGESRPLATNETPEGRAKNRRTDVVITPIW